MIADPISTVYDQIAALLQAEPTFYSKDGSDKSLIRIRNFILYSGTVPYADKQNKADGDFPEAVLDLGAFSDSAYTKWPTFNTKNSVVPQKEQFTQIYTLTLTLPDMRLAPANTLRSAACLALRRGGAALLLKGIVQSWGPITATPPDPREIPATGDRKRRIVKLSIPVNFLLNGADLIS